jgi:DNA-binding MarR family transcriptional regulator
MGPDLTKAIHEISLRMRLLRAVQEEKSSAEGLTERDVIILELLNERGKMTISQIAQAYPAISDSTISTNITRLWRDDKMTTIVELTEKGKKAIELIKAQRAERYQTLFNAINVTSDEKVVFTRILTRAIAFFDEYLGLNKTPKK